MGTGEKIKTQVKCHTRAWMAYTARATGLSAKLNLNQAPLNPKHR